MEADELAELYDAWASRLLAYMITLTRDRPTAEDALQNLFAKLAASRPDLRNPAVYLFRAARNEATRLSRRRRDVSLEGLDVLAPRPPGAPALEASEVARALDQLPAEQAEALMLHALEGLTFRELGEVTGVPPDTAASRVRYAIERMQILLKPWNSKTP